MELRDLAEEDPAEVRASEFDLNYIKLDGNIGCMVNGAGLAMATMDIIQLRAARPPIFSMWRQRHGERVTEAFKIILSDDNVKGILVNIFGGIMRCDIIAEGVVGAADAGAGQAAGGPARRHKCRGRKAHHGRKRPRYHSG